MNKEEFAEKSAEMVAREMEIDESTLGKVLGESLWEGFQKAISESKLSGYSHMYLSMSIFGAVVRFMANITRTMADDEKTRIDLMSDLVNYQAQGNQRLLEEEQVEIILKIAPKFTTEPEFTAREIK